MFVVDLIPCLCLTVPPYPKSNSKRDFGRREEVPPRSRAAINYGSRVATERRSYKHDDYPSRGSGYSDVAPRSASRTSARGVYVDDGYDRRVERLPPTYREGRARDHDTMSGSKRPCSALVSLLLYWKMRFQLQRPILFYFFHFPILIVEH